jgi:hypothetical protein
MLIGGALLAPTLVFAEPAASKKPAEAPSLRQKLSDSRDLLKADRGDALEANLAKDAHSKPKSVEWHQEMAANLLRVAFSAQEAGDTASAQKAARRALAQLDRVEALAQGDAKTLASVSELRGVIAERLLGTTADAVTEYKKALVRDPNSPSARHKLRQTDSSENAATQAK